MALDAEALRLRAAVMAVAVLLTGCGSDPPASPTTQLPTASPTLQPPSPSMLEPSAGGPSPSSRVVPGIAIPQPGRPFDGTVLLDAMRTSRRPGGVPDQLETDAIATALADAIWTYGGEPWTTMAIGGSCGTATCTLEAAGTRPNSLGEDLWVFEITPSTGTVTVASASLGAMPAEIIGPLDALTNTLFRPGRLDGLSLAFARWLPPPAGGQFVLSYRSGGEEGSCGADVTLDAVVPEIVDDRIIDCG